METAESKSIRNRRATSCGLAAFSLLWTGCAHLGRDAASLDDVVKLIHPSTREVEAAIDDKRVRTLINFRGFEPDQNWYREQVQLCRAKKVKFIDATLNAHGPEREEIIELLESFRTDEKPIALCDGWDGERAGFAMGLYRLAILKEDREAARRELPLWHSQHAPLPRLRAFDRFFVDWRDEREFYATYQLPSKGTLRSPSTPPASKPEARREALSSLEQPPKTHDLWRDISATGALANGPGQRTQVRAEANRESTSPSRRRVARESNWLQAWLSKQRGADLIWTQNDGLQEATTMRDYRSMIVDAPTNSGPRLWGRAQPLSDHAGSVISLPAPSSGGNRGNGGVERAAHWESTEAEDRPPRRSAAALGKPTN